MKHLYETVAETVIAHIEQGVYKPGEKLPGVRKLSQQLHVSISTALEAYRLLEDSGRIQARLRSGYYVSSFHRQAITEPEISDAPVTPAKVTGQSLTRQILRAAKDPYLINLGSSVPHADFLPTHALQQATGKVSRTFGKRCFDADELLGNQELRRQIAKRMVELQCADSPDDIVVTHGAREAVRLALMAICQPGDLIAIESPTFYGLLQVIESCGMEALEIPTHPRDGLSLDALQMAIEQWPIKACLIVSNYNNPLGSCMSDERKQALVALLEKHEIPLVEDDVYGDLGFGLRRSSVIGLQGLEPQWPGVVLQLFRQNPIAGHSGRLAGAGPLQRKSRKPQIHAAPGRADPESVNHRPHVGAGRLRPLPAASASGICSQRGTGGQGR